MRRVTRIWLPPQTAEIHRVKRRMRPVQIAVLAILALALMVLGISFSYLLEKAPILVATIPLVLYVAFWGTALACFLGFFGALGLLSPRPVFNVPAKLYVSLGQGVPVIVVLFLLYFGLPPSSLVASPDFDTSRDPGPRYHQRCLPERGIPGQYPVGTLRSDRGRPGNRYDGCESLPSCDLSPGSAECNPSDRQLLHFHSQGLDVGELHRCCRTLFQGAEHWPA